MFSCEQVIQEIWAYLDKDCKKEDLPHIKEHLELCRSCFSRVEFEQKLRISIKEKTEHCCPDKVKARIKSILDQF